MDVADARIARAMLSGLATTLADRYAIERELGSGGMATVYLAHDLRHDRKVAVKLLRPEVAEAAGTERFLREIHITAQLQHPNILTLIESGATADASGGATVPYFVMPYVEGQTLRQWLTRAGRLPVADVVRILGEVADALDYAHVRGIVHRDVKPENVLLSGRHAMVMDFGVAKALDAATGTHAGTAVGLVLGTPSYMAPEQALGDPVDQRADIYALGVLAYEMLAGRLPFPGATARHVVAAQLTTVADPLWVHCANAPPALANLVGRCLARNPAERPQTARAVVEALERIATPAGGVEAVPAVRGRSWRAWWTALATLLAITTLVGGGWWLSSRAPASARGARPSRLVVLPFENQGPEPESYFTDGMVDEVRGLLTGLPELRVIARTSSEAYRGSRATLQQIGRELRVEYVLTGTVQWQEGAGASRIRVSPELTRTSDGTTVWRQSFDAEVADAFDVQHQVAAEVAQALDLALASDDGRDVRRPTGNAAAYTLFLLGVEQFKRAQATDGNGRVAAELFARATALDPSFALAFARLSIAHVHTYWNGGDRTRARLDLATRAAERALAIAPELPEAHLAMGYVRYWGHRDYAGALREFRIALRARPHDAVMLFPFGPVARREGRWDDAIVALRQVVDLDPRNVSAMDDLGGTLSRVGRHQEALLFTDSALTLSPFLVVGWRTSVIARIAAGDFAGARSALRRADSTLSRRSPAWFFEKPYPGFEATFAALLEPATRRRLAALPLPPAFASDASAFYTLKVALALASGDRAALLRHADSASATLGRQIEANPTEPLWRAQLAVTELHRGRAAAAIDAAQRAVRLLPIARDQVDGPMYEAVLAQVHATAGNADSAIAHLEQVTRVPSFWSGPALRAAPAFASLRGDPRFERLAPP